MKSHLIVLAAFTSQALSQAETSTEFPEGATVATSNEVKEGVGGKVFLANISPQEKWRLQYNKNGYIFLNSTRGWSDSGRWAAEDGKLCMELPKIPKSCNEVRIKDGALYLMRDSGQVVPYISK